MMKTNFFPSDNEPSTEELLFIESIAEALAKALNISYHAALAELCN